MEPTDLLEQIIENNRKFVGSGGGGDADDLVSQKAPVAYIACSDARFNPDALGSNLQFAFKAYNPGNAFTGYESLASMEYTVAHNKSKLLMVIGHEGCGAVNSVVSGDFRNEEGSLRVHLDVLYNQLRDYIEYGKKQKMDSHFYEVMNVDVQVRNLLRNSPTVRDAVERGEAMVVGMMYLLRKGSEGKLVVTNVNGKDDVRSIKKLVPKGTPVERGYANPMPFY